MGDTLPRAAVTHPPLPSFNSAAQLTSPSTLLFPDVDLAAYTATTTEAADSVPHPAALYPRMPHVPDFEHEGVPAVATTGGSADEVAGAGGGMEEGNHVPTEQADLKEISQES